MAQVRHSPAPSLQDRARAYDPFIVESARRYRIDPRILRAVCFIESRFRVEATSPKGARGLMQFMPATATRYRLRNPYDPRDAIDAAAHYLGDLLRKFGGRIDLALASYNAGEGTVESFQTGKPLVLATGKIINPRGLITGGIPPYRETQQYVRFGIGLLTTSSISSTPHLSSLRELKSPLHRAMTSDQKRLKSTSPTRPTSSSFIDVQ